MQNEVNQKKNDWNDCDKVKHGVGSRDKLMHVDKSNLCFVMKKMLVYRAMVATDEDIVLQEVNTSSIADISVDWLVHC